MMLVKTKVAASRIHGVGLFADEDIPKKKVIWEYNSVVDKRISAEEIKTLPRIAQEFLLGHSFFKQGFYILCGDNGRFINHSDNPNIGGDEDYSVTMRDIQSGEEITDNYDNYEDGPLP